MSFPGFKLIKSVGNWQTCLAALQREPRLAIDLESNSMFAYQEEVCLIQISIPGQDYIVDPLAGLDLEDLGVIVEDPAVEKVFHAAEYDLMLMKRQYGWELQNLFDTMWAARILGYKRIGLANVLERKFSVKLNKRYQRSNWCARPLSDDQLAYAQKDTHYLLDLADVLTAELETAGRLAEAREIFVEQSTVQLPDLSFDPDSFWSINGVRDLPAAGKAVARELNIYRDQEAGQRNKPAFKIFGNKTILAVAKAMPRQMSDLHEIHGMSGGQIRRYGRKMVQIVQENADASSPPRPSYGQRPPDDVYNRYEALHTWRKRRARKRGVESDVVISRDALWALAHANPRTREALAAVNGLGPVRLNMYADEILQVLARNQ